MASQIMTTVTRSDHGVVLTVYDHGQIMRVELNPKKAAGNGLDLLSLALEPLFRLEGMGPGRTTLPAAAIRRLSKEVTPDPEALRELLNEAIKQCRPTRPVVIVTDIARMPCKALVQRIIRERGEQAAAVLATKLNAALSARGKDRVPKSSATLWRPAGPHRQRAAAVPAQPGQRG